MLGSELCRWGRLDDTFLIARASAGSSDVVERETRNHGRSAVDMSEYGTFKGFAIKLGTCEDMYYLRADQRHEIEGYNLSTC